MQRFQLNPVQAKAWRKSVILAENEKVQKCNYLMFFLNFPKLYFSFEVFFNFR